MKFKIALIFAFFSLSVEAQKWEPIDPEFDAVFEYCDSLREYFGPSEYSVRRIEKLKEIARRHNSKPMEWRILYYEGVVLSDNYREDLGIEKIKRSLDLVDSIEHNYEYHRILWVKEMMENVGDLTARYQFAFHELKYYSGIKDYLMMAVCHQKMGQCLLSIDSFDKAKQHIEKSIELLDKAGYHKGAFKEQYKLIDVYMGLNDVEMARKIYRELIDSPIVRADMFAMIWILEQGYYYGFTDDGLMLANRLAQSCGDKFTLWKSNIAMGEHYRTKIGDYRTAIAYYKVPADSFFQKNRNFNILTLMSLNGLSQCYDSLGMIDSAYIYSLRYNTFKDSILVDNSPAKFQAMYEKLSIERTEEKVAEEHRRFISRILLITLVFGLILIGISGVVYYIQTKRRQAELQQRLKEAENETLIANIEREKIEKQLIKERCEANERQLATNSLLLIEKKQMIEYLNREIEQNGNEGKIDREVKRNLLNFIKIHQGTEEGMRQFYDYFNQVHPDFFQRLKDRFPALTKGDLRLCGYLRMGLDSKQIAQIMSIQPEAIKQGRHRLRVKFGLGPSVSLDDFINAQ